jgi:hypothetical protein
MPGFGPAAKTLLQLLAKNVRPVAQQAGRSLINAAPTVRQGLVQGGKQIGHLATNPIIVRNVEVPLVAGAAGYGAGHTAGSQLENQAAQTKGRIAPWTGGLGALTAMSIASPALRGQLRYMAGLTAGQPWSRHVWDPNKGATRNVLSKVFGGLGTTKNMLSKPHYPIIEPYLTSKLPTASRYGFGLLRRAPMAAGTAGLGYGGYAAATALPDTMAYDVARDQLGVSPETQNRVWWDTLKKQWEIPGRMYGIGWDKDKTLVGDLHRSAVPNVVVPEVLNSIFGPSRSKSTVGTTIDAAGSTTPWKPVNRLLQRAILPNVANAAGLTSTTSEELANLLQANEHRIATDPELLKSPLLSLYTNILAQPDVINDVRRRGLNHFQPGATKIVNKALAASAGRVYREYVPERYRRYTDYLDTAANIAGVHPLNYARGLGSEQIVGLARDQLEKVPAEQLAANIRNSVGPNRRPLTGAHNSTVERFLHSQTMEDLRRATNQWAVEGLRDEAQRRRKQEMKRGAP